MGVRPDALQETSVQDMPNTGCLRRFLTLPGSSATSNSPDATAPVNRLNARKNPN